MLNHIRNGKDEKGGYTENIGHVHSDFSIEINRQKCAVCEKQIV